MQLLHKQANFISLVLLAGATLAGATETFPWSIYWTEQPDLFCNHNFLCVLVLVMCVCMCLYCR